MRLMLPFLFLAAACSPAPEQPAANQSEPAAEQPEAAPVPELAGQWTVTAINGSPPDQVWPMQANVNEVRFLIESDCVRMAFDYMQDRNVVRFTPQPAQSCERVRSPAELMVEKPVSLANIAMFSNAGREVQLTGPGGSVTMTRR